MDSPFIRAAQSANALRLQDHIDLLSMFSPVVARMRAQQKRVDDMKHLSAIEIRNRFVPVTPGRKPVWAKIEEETAMCYEVLRRKYEGSCQSVSVITVADIIDQYRKSHPDPEPEPAFRYNIFRDFYFRVVKKFF